VSSRVRCHDTAAELSQEAFLKVCLSDNLDCVRNLKAYLFCTALNLLTDHYRRRAVQKVAIIERRDDELRDNEDHRSTVGWVEACGNPALIAELSMYNTHHEQRRNPQTLTRRWLAVAGH
jgi:DNA-directed RNA polymerase specialized sigma24 family protein